MHKPTKKAILFFILLLAPLITGTLTKVNAQSGTEQSSMINGVLAHEMSAQEAKTLAKSNITWVSCDVTTNPYDDCEWTQIYSLAKQYNLSLVGILDWHLMNYSKTFQLSDWNSAVNQAISNFGDIVKTWEVWNEPNFSWNSYGFYNGTAQQYVTLMQATYEDIKAAAPDDTVIGLGGVPLFTGAEPTINNTYASQAYAWAQNVVQLGGMNYCDAIGIHAYPYGAYNVISQLSFGYFLQNYQQLCQGKPIWVTEVGQESYSTNWTATESQQSNFLSQSYSLLQGLGVKAYIWYELNDNYTDRPDSNFGLFNNSGNPKQAFTTFSNLASPNSSPTPAPSSSATLSSMTPTATSTQAATDSPEPIIPEVTLVPVSLLIIAISLCAIIARKHQKSLFEINRIQRNAILRFTKT